MTILQGKEGIEASEPEARDDFQANMGIELDGTLTMKGTEEILIEGKTNLQPGAELKFQLYQEIMIIGSPNALKH